MTLIDFFGDRVDAAFVTGTDFGTQRGPFISNAAYRELYKPFHERVNSLIHAKSKWKTFIHSCGSVYNLIPEFIEAGFDILNPVQCSAACMDPADLKKAVRRQHRLLGWRRRHAEDDRVRHAGRSPSGGPPADRGAESRRRHGLQFDSQCPGPHAHAEHVGHVRCDSGSVSWSTIRWQFFNHEWHESARMRHQGYAMTDTSKPICSAGRDFIGGSSAACRSRLGDDQGSVLYLVLICFVATLGGLLFGYDTAVIADAILYLKPYFDSVVDDGGLAGRLCAGRLRRRRHAGGFAERLPGAQEGAAPVRGPVRRFRHRHGVAAESLGVRAIPRRSAEWASVRRR